VKGRWGFKKTIDVFKEVTIAWPKARAKLVENKANGPAIEDQLKSQIAGIRLVEPQGGKLARAMACEPYIEAGNIYLPDPKFHPWIEEFIEEAAAFPNATHDDEVDAASQSINYLMGKGNRLLKMLSM
jgi:predicted phage terminase large subunit-like protein